MIAFKKIRIYGTLAILITSLGLQSCSDDNVSPTTPPPPVENEEEVITDLKLIFTNALDNSDTVTARAKDPDGEGTRSLMVIDSIQLEINKSYLMELQIMNNLKTPSTNIAKEIKEEDDEHQFFFGFSNNAFMSPAGDGNIDNSADPLNYDDEDSESQDGSGNPVGLMTSWTTSSNTLSNGSFNVRLQHQPDGIKTATSGATDGDTDINITFVLNIN